MPEHVMARLFDKISVYEEPHARQFIPAANRGWDKKFPDIFVIKQGRMRTAGLTGLGLGAG